MKVILLEDVKKVGKKNEVVEVSDGFAMNFLINRKLAIAANESNLKNLQLYQKSKIEESLLQQKLAQNLKEKLETMTLNFSLKKGSEGRAFGSITAKMICQYLFDNHRIEIDKRKFVDDVNIHNFGTTLVKIELFKNIIATVKIEVSEQ